ncbi:MAG: hypothetical protein KDM91_16510, partial [Verrucomicrobiae bacterium]|nr:hypothetical protein [Verrucomicrobiae bacterium]
YDSGPTYDNLPTYENIPTYDDDQDDPEKPKFRLYRITLTKIHYPANQPCDTTGLANLYLKTAQIIDADTHKDQEPPQPESTRDSNFDEEINTSNDETGRDCAIALESFHAYTDEGLIWVDFTII